jgi:hypothetical protein
MSFSHDGAALAIATRDADGEIEIVVCDLVGSVHGRSRPKKVPKVCSPR